MAEQDSAHMAWENFWTLDGQNRRTRLLRAEIEELRESPASLMPERLLDTFDAWAEAAGLRE